MTTDEQIVGASNDGTASTGRLGYADNEQGFDTHDPAGMAAFMRRRAQCSREFLKLTGEQQIRQFMESWQRNVLPHFAFRFEQGAEMIERLERALTETHDAWTAETTARLQAEHALAELRADAVETVQHWGGYVSDYFREKHDLTGDIKRLRGSAPDVSANLSTTGE